MTEYTALGTMAGLRPRLSPFLECDLEVTPTEKGRTRRKQASIMHKAYTVFIHLGD